MPKNTAKYSGACQKANELNIPIGQHQEELYQALNSQGFYWNSKEKSWEKLDEEADPPTELIRIRVWTDARFVEKVANECIESLAQKGMRLVEKSEVFKCRPPKQLEARIYLTFQKEPENIQKPQEHDVVLGSNLR